MNETGAYAQVGKEHLLEARALVSLSPLAMHGPPPQRVFITGGSGFSKNLRKKLQKISKARHVKYTPDTCCMHAERSS